MYQSINQLAKVWTAVLNNVKKNIRGRYNKKLKAK